MSSNETDSEHRERMQTLQKEMRARMKAATDRRGLIIVHTGNGKGKTTAAFGMLARMLANGHKCAVVQFIKSGGDSVERLLRGPLLQWDRVGEGFTWDTQDRAADIASCRKGWEIACRHFDDPDIDFVVLDELNIALNFDYLPRDEVIDRLKAKRTDQHIVITGRDAHKDLIELADLVTEMKDIKHPFSKGVQAQRGIEF